MSMNWQLNKTTTKIEELNNGSMRKLKMSQSEENMIVEFDIDTLGGQNCHVKEKKNFFS